MISFNCKTTRSRLLRGVILLLWLLSVPGLRPAFHQHQDENYSATAIEELADHLRIFQHDDSIDSAEFHMHWLVQLDGNPIPSFPNGPIPLEQSSTSCLIENLELTSTVFDSEQAYWFSVWASVPIGDDLSIVAASCTSDRLIGPCFVPCRIRSECATTLYCAAYL